MIMDNCKLALDIGGTSVKFGLVRDNCVIYSSELNVDSTGTSEQILDKFQKVVVCANEKAEEMGFSIGHIGVSVPGPFDYKRGASMMKHKYISLYDIPLTDYLCKPLNKNVSVRFISDAGAFLLGALEILQIRSEKICCITIGTGIGFACAENKNLMCNEKGGPFLQLFSMPYLDGCIEDYISKRAIENRYRQLGGNLKDNASVKEIAIRARNNEKTAKDVFNQVGSDIVIAMSPIMQKYNFTSLVIGGQIARAYDLLLPAMIKEMNNRSYRYDIFPGGEIAQAALLGSVQE